MKNFTSLFRIILFVLTNILFFYQASATPLSVSITNQKNVSCNGGTNGTATASATGGTSPYTYVWSTNPTQAGVTATGLSAGTYTVGVVDANFTTASVSVTITQPTPLITTSSSTNNTSCKNPNGTATAIPSGGTSPYGYIWEPTYSATQPTDTGLSPGTYTCIVYDNAGCRDTIKVTVSGTPAPFLAISSTPSFSYHYCNATATASVSGGTLPYTYLWSPGGYTSAKLTNICAHYYRCTVTDNIGCSTYDFVDIDTSLYCINGYNEPICIVTLDTATNKCEILWDRANSPPAGGYGHFNIYRDSNNTYKLTHSQPLNVLSDYIDPNSNPSAGAVSYKISTVDSCGESALSSVHTSIYLTATAGRNVYILNWTAYVGFTPSKYIIYRGPSLSKLTAIDSVANNILTYHDTIPPPSSYYVVEAENPNGPCVPTTHKSGKSSISLLSGAFSNGHYADALGVNNLKSSISGLTIYPNPTSGRFTINYSIIGNDNVTISIFNELGQEVYTKQKQVNNGAVTETLNMNGLAPGIYTLRLQTTNGVLTRKILIM